jgi:hypothetical protein
MSEAETQLHLCPPQDALGIKTRGFYQLPCL